MNINEDIAKAICKMFPECKPSYLSGKMLFKFVNGEWVGKQYVKDPNHTGYRYIWEEEINQAVPSGK